MRHEHHMERQIDLRPNRAALALVFCTFITAGITGCAHKKLKSVLPVGVLAPVDLESAPSLDTMIANVPAPELKPLPPPPPPKPVIRRRPAPKEEPPAPAQVATEATPSPAALALGALTAGSDATPESQQQARDLIASIQKRISDLPAKIADAEKKQIRQVRNFLDQAQQALNTGDSNGAINLANKARLIMDDIEQK